MPKLRGILLDFYGTLVHEDDVNISCITDQMYRHAALSTTASEIGRFWYDSFFRLSDRSFGESFMTQRKLGLESLGETFRQFGVDLKPEDVIERQFAHWVAPPIFPEAVEFLAHVKALDLPICLVSNIDRADVQAAMRVHGLNFEFLVTSEDARAYKPRPEMFRMALKSMEFEPDELLHVGDSQTSDVGGASRLGIPVAWVNRFGKSVHGEHIANYEVRDLTELIPIVDRLV